MTMFDNYMPAKDIFYFFWIFFNKKKQFHERQYSQRAMKIMT